MRLALAAIFLLSADAAIAAPSSTESNKDGAVHTLTVRLGGEQQPATVREVYGDDVDSPSTARRTRRQLTHRAGLVNDQPPTRRRPIVLPSDGNQHNQQFSNSHQGFFAPEMIEEVRYAPAGSTGESSIGKQEKLRAPVVSGGYANTKLQGFASGSGARTKPNPAARKPTYAPSTRPTRGPTTRTTTQRTRETRPPTVRSSPRPAPTRQTLSRATTKPSPVEIKRVVVAANNEQPAMQKDDKDEQEAKVIRPQTGRVPLFHKLAAGRKPGRTRDRVPFIPRRSTTESPRTVTSKPKSSPVAQLESRPRPVALPQTSRRPEDESTSSFVPTSPVRVSQNQKPEITEVESISTGHQQVGQAVAQEWEYTQDHHHHEHRPQQEHGFREEFQPSLQVSWSGPPADSVTEQNHFNPPPAPEQASFPPYQEQYPSNQGQYVPQHTELIPGPLGPYYEERPQLYAPDGRPLIPVDRIPDQPRPFMSPPRPLQPKGPRPGMRKKPPQGNRRRLRPGLQNQAPGVRPIPPQGSRPTFHESSTHSPEEELPEIFGPFYAEGSYIGHPGHPNNHEIVVSRPPAPELVALQPEAPEGVRPNLRPRRPPTTEAPGYFDAILSWFTSKDDEDDDAPVNQRRPINPNGRPWRKRPRPEVSSLRPPGADYMPGPAVGERLEPQGPPEIQPLTEDLRLEEPSPDQEPSQSQVDVEWKVPTSEPKPEKKVPIVLPQFRPNAPVAQLFPQAVIPRGEEQAGSRRPQLREGVRRQQQGKGTPTRRRPGEKRRPVVNGPPPPRPDIVREDAQVRPQIKKPAQRIPSQKNDKPRRPPFGKKPKRRPEGQNKGKRRPQLSSDALNRPLETNEVQRRRGEPEPAVAGPHVPTLQMLHPALSKPSVLQALRAPGAPRPPVGAPRLPPGAPRPSMPQQPLRGPRPGQAQGQASYGENRPLTQAGPYQPAGSSPDTPYRPGQQPPNRRRPPIQRQPSQQKSPGVRQRPGPLRQKPKPILNGNQPGNLQGIRGQVPLPAPPQGARVPTARPATLMDDRRIMVVGPFDEPPPGAPYIPHPEHDPAAAAVVAQQVSSHPPQVEESTPPYMLEARVPDVDINAKPSADVVGTENVPEEEFMSEGGLEEMDGEGSEVAESEEGMVEEDLLPLTPPPTAASQEHSVTPETASNQGSSSQPETTSPGTIQPDTPVTTPKAVVEEPAEINPAQTSEDTSPNEPSTKNNRTPAGGKPATSEQKDEPQPMPEPGSSETPVNSGHQFVFATNADSPLLTQTFAQHSSDGEVAFDGTEDSHRPSHKDMMSQTKKSDTGVESNDALIEEGNVEMYPDRVIAARLVAGPPLRGSESRETVSHQEDSLNPNVEERQELRVVGGSLAAEDEANVPGSPQGHPIQADTKKPVVVAAQKVPTTMKTTNKPTTTAPITTTTTTTTPAPTTTITTTTTQRPTTRSTTKPPTTRPPTRPPSTRPTTRSPTTQRRYTTTPSRQQPRQTTPSYDLVTAESEHDATRDVMTLEVTHSASYGVRGNAPPPRSTGGVGTVTSVDIGTGDVRFDSPEVTYYRPRKPEVTRYTEPEVTRYGEADRKNERLSLDQVIGAITNEERKPTPGFHLPALYQGFEPLLD